MTLMGGWINGYTLCINWHFGVRVDWLELLRAFSTREAFYRLFF